MSLLRPPISTNNTPIAHSEVIDKMEWKQVTIPKSGSPPLLTENKYIYSGSHKKDGKMKEHIHGEQLKDKKNGPMLVKFFKFFFNNY